MARLEGFALTKMLKHLIFLVALAATPAAAHDFECGGRPVPSDVKLSCCGKADHHFVDPANVSRDAAGDWIVRSGPWTFAIPDEKVQPSDDGCFHIFYEDRQSSAYEHGAEFRSAGEPTVYCFQAPLVGLGEGGLFDDWAWGDGGGGSIAPRGAAAPELSSWAYLLTGFVFLFGGKLWTRLSPRPKA